MAVQNASVFNVSRQALRRYPYYLRYLKQCAEEGAEHISAPMIAGGLGYNEVQVRKDIALVSSCGGKPKTGYEIRRLIRDIESFLGYDNVDEAVLVGAGQLGRSLLYYKGFEEYGIRVVAAFDSDESVVGAAKGEKPVFPMSKLRDLCGRMRIHIGIITVPADQAQSVCNELVACGVLAVWNFAPVHLKVPEGIIVQNENMASSLAVLSSHLRDKFTER